MADTLASIGQRLEQYLKHKGIGTNQLGRMSETSGTQVSRIIHGETAGLDKLIKMLNVLPDLSTEWLLHGRGEMLLSTDADEGNVKGKVNGKVSLTDKTKGTKKAESEPVQTDNLRILVATVDSKDRENIALVSTRVAAGYADGGFMNPEFMKDLPSFSLPDSAYKNATFRAFQVSGDSMQPTLWEGDWVICRFIDHWDRDIRDTFVHVIVTDDRPVVKRLLNRLNERGQLTLQSDNPAYPAQFLDGERVREVWVAVGRLSRQFANPRYDLIQEVSRSRADIDELMLRLDTLEQRQGRVTRLKNLD